MSGRDLEAYIQARLRELQAKPKRTISWLAREAGVNRNTFYDWFSKDVVPDPDTLQRVATALGRTYTELWEAYEGRTDRELRDALTDWQDGYDVGFQRGFAAGLAARGSADGDGQGPRS